MGEDDEESNQAKNQSQTSQKSKQNPYDPAALYSVSIPIILVNLIEIILLLKRRKILLPYELILLSLAIADLNVGIAELSLAIIRLPDNDSLRSAFAKGFLWYTIKASVFHVAALTIDRLIAVTKPLLHKLWVTRKRITYVIIAIWVVLFAVIAPFVGLQLMDSVQVVIAYMVVSSGVLIVSSYAFIVYKAVFLRRIQMKANSGPSKAGPSNEQLKREFRLVFVSLLVAVSFVAMTFPYAVNQLLPKPSETFLEGKMLIICNSLVNPLIYFFWKYIERKQAERQKKSKDRSTNDRKSTEDTNETAT